jgi:phosphoribosylanthranilate isomerase
MNKARRFIELQIYRFPADIWSMSLKAKVKVGNVTNLSDARYCAGMGVDLLGFPVGEGGLKPEQYKQLIDWVSGPEFVLEAYHSKSADLQYITDNYPGHYIEIGSHQLDWLSREDLNFVVAIKAEEWVKIKGRKNVKFVEILEWNKEEIDPEIPALINTDDVAAVLKTNHGIALSGSDEEKPGIKDYGAMADILEALEVE